MASDQLRRYHRSNSIVFLKTNEAFGGLSNMAGGYPLFLQGQRIHTSEALYQCCRFPHMPEVQQLIVEQISPMTAKMKSKPYRKQSRKDWDQVRVRIMRWCLRVKLVQNWEKFSELLLNTGDKPIVEESRRDDFWGAKPASEQILVGMNVLGRLLMELREAVREQGRNEFRKVEPLGIPNFQLFGRPIGPVAQVDALRIAATKQKEAGGAGPRRTPEKPAQGSLFDSSSVQDSHESSYAAYELPNSDPSLNFQPYTEMKDFGVAWLGPVPEHWDLLPNRAIFTEVKERGHPDAEMLSVTIKNGVIRQRELLEGSSKKDSSNLDKSAYKLVRPGDIAYNKMRAWQGAVGMSVHKGIISPAYVVQRPRDGVNPRYLHYLLRTPAFAKEAERWSYGITSDMWSLRPEHFKLIYSCLPPAPEQTAIVRFLDYMDRRIQRYIRAKQKLIKLLEELKAAIIHRAVTHGLDPDVRLKPSGVEWLGDVPEHWEVMRMKYVAEGIQMGPFGASLTELQEHDTGYKLYGQENTISGDFYKGRRWVTREQYSALQRYELLPGDLVLTRKGSIGKCKMVPTNASRGIMDSDTIRVRLDGRRVSDRYVVLLLQDAAYVQRQIESVQRGAILAGLNTSTIGNLCLAVPPVHEQSTMLVKVEAATALVSRALSDSVAEINLLRQYRTRLIADVVTGKLDVREAAAGLPDEPAEQESDELADSEAIDILNEEPEAEEV